MQNYKYVILGGGMVAGYAAQELAVRGLNPRELAIISADNRLPYERPPLSKDFLAGNKEEPQILINDEEFYRTHGITLFMETRVRQVDFAGRQVLTTGEAMGYEKLLIATGAEPRRLDVPGNALDGIYYLRSLQDARRIREAYAGARRAVVIGSGFIGMEVAAVLTQRNIEVTMVYPETRVWERFFTPEMSAYFERYYAERGVRLRPRCRVTGFKEGATGRLQAVLLDSHEALPADLVVAGIGVSPVVGPFRGSGLTVDNGIVVNEFLETAVPEVYAAGDVANYNDMIFGCQRRFEHWDNAVAQGKHVALAMTGYHKPFIHVPYFFSDEFDLSYEVWGDAHEADQVVYRGDVNSGRFSTWWFREGRPVAAFVMNRPDEERELAQEWIWKRIQVPVDALQDETRKLSSLDV